MPTNAPKGKFHMSLLSKRLVSIAASTILLSLVSTGAHAQGSWYTNRAIWESLVTNVQTANYNGSSFGTSVGDNGVTATGSELFQRDGALITYADNAPITFTFSGNAFYGEFYSNVAGSFNFSVDNSLTNVYSLPTASTAGSGFLGYISDSASPITVKVSPSVSTGLRLRVPSFSFGDGTNPANPGSNVAPEPGTFALALTGGGALIGICIRRRRNAA
jgi:VCBS repeat-containing protein